MYIILYVCVGTKNAEGQMNQAEGAMILFANGNTYIGGMKEDMLHGKGILRDVVQQSLYDGQFFEDQRHGHATFTYPGGRYEGQYQNNKRHGRGRDEDDAGNIFDGEFVVGDFVRGTVTYANGDIYTGEVKDDSRSGRGKLVTRTGKVLEGVWDDDEFISST
jgi:hypothetical protein